MKLKISFHGGASGVTGSNFLFETEKSKFLVDCGFFQGRNICDEKNIESFPYDPESIQYVFITHAHLDHVGRLPKLVKDGFRGTIISTAPTKDIAESMLFDGVGLVKEEAQRCGYEQIYKEEDVKAMFEKWQTVEYHEVVTIEDSLEVRLKNSGHILGSAMVEISHNDRKMVITGDLGNSPSPLLPDPEEIVGTTYLAIESVYGDRKHVSRGNRQELLEDVIENTIRRNGVLMIPAFSIERTQEILYEIETMVSEKRIPDIPVFLDSPLAIKVTHIYEQYKEYFNKDVQETFKKRNKIFSYPNLHYTASVEDSKAIARAENPKIIIAGSGMSNGGRIIHHEKHYLGEPNNTLLFVGYQAPNSLGREIQDGAKTVEILGDNVSIKARIETIGGYSAHKDMDDLLDYTIRTVDSLKKVFVIMGEPKSSAFLSQRLRDYVGVDSVAPREGDSFEIEL